ncbi:cytochrome P450 [Streptomyces sp. NPDC088801]|uniref:cytochrome P450 n=1 Tax=Streptomyces sp. NPDC088801 TaxID=3365903 RepID=UPI0037FFB858
MPIPESFVDTGLDDDIGLDLTDPATFVGQGLDEFWQRLRTEQPVARHRATASAPAFWVLSRYDDVMAVMKEAERFVSRHGNMLTSLLSGGDPAGGRLLAVMDAPRHTALRTTLLKSFSPRALRGVVAKVRARAEERVTAAVAMGECDFAVEVSDHVPMGTICDLLGVPDGDQAELLRLSKQALSSDEAGQSAEDAWLARNEILLYFAELAAHRRAAPQDDLITALTTVQVDGAPLAEEELVLNCYGLVLAGDETGRLAATGTVWNLLRHPDQWAALKEGRVEVATAVEEILRWTSPALHVGRTAATDVRIGGRTIKAGEAVTAWNVSANRDESVFTDPYRFDLARTPNRHLTFGFGPHFCLGSYLGRAELTAVLEALLRRVDSIESLGAPKPVYSTFLQGYSSLPVRLHAAEDGER